MIKHFIYFVCALAFMVPSQAHASDPLSALSGLLNNGTVENLINGVISSSNIDVKDLSGTWKYKAPAVAFESEDLLKKAGGVAAASTIKSKIAPYYTKAGLSGSSITFDQSGNFSMSIKKLKITGKVTKANGYFNFAVNGFAGTKGFTMKSYIKKGTTLEITFNASKLVTLLSRIAKASGNSTITTISSLLDGYNGVYAGFEYSK